MLNQRILHILLSEYKVDSRVRNETESLLRSGYDIDVFCLKSNDTQSVEYRNGVKIIRYGKTSNKKIRIITSYIMFILKSFNINYKLVHAHDLTGLIVGFIISGINKIPLIYDTHELWSESEHEQYPRWVMKAAYWIEKFCARRADFIITVSDSIKEYLINYFSTYNFETIRNIPSYDTVNNSDIRKKIYKIDEDESVFIYTGSINENRGMLTILNALKIIEESNYRFIFLVDDKSIEQLKRYVKEFNLESRVFILKSVPQDELMAYLKCADVGIIAIKNTCLNHYYALPNKVFEYIKAGIAILCTEIKEMSALVHEYDIGITFRSGDAQDLADKIVKLINERNMVEYYKSNSLKISKQLTWDNEFSKLKNIYVNLLK